MNTAGMGRHKRTNGSTEDGSEQRQQKTRKLSDGTSGGEQDNQAHEADANRNRVFNGMSTEELQKIAQGTGYGETIFSSSNRDMICS